MWFALWSPSLGLKIMVNPYRFFTTLKVWPSFNVNGICLLLKYYWTEYREIWFIKTIIVRLQQIFGWWIVMAAAVDVSSSVSSCWIWVKWLSLLQQLLDGELSWLQEWSWWWNSLNSMFYTLSIWIYWLITIGIVGEMSKILLLWYSSSKRLLSWKKVWKKWLPLSCKMLLMELANFPARVELDLVETIFQQTLFYKCQRIHCHVDVRRVFPLHW